MLHNYSNCSNNAIIRANANPILNPTHRKNVQTYSIRVHVNDLKQSENQL